MDMPELTTVATDGDMGGPAAARPRPFESRVAGELNRSHLVMPPLHGEAARTILRDRWERLGTVIDVPQPPDVVWEALTKPSALRRWLAVCHGSITETEKDCTLDFEDGEFFLCRAVEANEPRYLRYLWRWLGIGQASSVTWRLEPHRGGTHITVLEEAKNPPWDWQTWNGGGWPGILEQLAAYLRTGTEWRWPWRRIGPYAQVELPMPLFQAWFRLLEQGNLRYWLQLMRGEFVPGETVTILMGDASGAVEFTVELIVEPGEEPTSFLPRLDFALERGVWGRQVKGRIWMEPAGWGRSLLQVVHFGWENLPPDLQLSERKILTDFWAGAVRRATQTCGGLASMAPHGWS